MQWRFTIIDRNGIKTVVDEPNGWADFQTKLKRHPQRHGTFREIQANNFQFFEKAVWLLKPEYDAYGPKGDMTLLVELRIPTGWWEFYRGIFLFPSYHFSFEIGTGAYVTIDVDQAGPVVDLINRFEQSVDITKNISFDGTTALTDYPFLDFNMTFPSKAIFIRAEAVTQNTVDSPADYHITSDVNAPLLLLPNQVANGFFIPKLNQTNLDEIPVFSPSIQFDYDSYYDGKPFLSQIENYQILQIKPDSLLQNANVYNVDLRFNGSVITKYQQNGAATGGGIGVGLSTISFRLSVVMKYGKSKLDAFTPVVIDTFSDTRGEGQPEISHITNIDFSYTGPVTLGRDEKLWPLFILEIGNSSNSVFSPINDVVVSFAEDSYFRVTSATKVAETSSKVWMINEATSRVIESITDNQLKLYSEYFGRQNSQPYNVSVDGCGSGRILTNGLQIRNVRLADGSIPGVFMSLKDIFDALVATDNIGLGSDGDNLIRMENWKWFYQNNIVHRCTDIAKIDRIGQEAEIYSTFKCGYDKWESENYNGLDEFLTSREFRLDIPQVKNSLEQICKFMASGYAIEVTRRMGNTSTDWQYDNNIFIICVEPDGASYKVELNNILNPANLVDPPTIYNFRLSPMRNAMRWFDRVIGSYRNVNTGHKIIFASADGNYVAEGQLVSGTCTMEAGVIRENQDLTISAFIDQADALPIMWPERVKYSYPLGANEYKNIQNNPYGLIAFTSPADSGYGWIDEIDYKPNDGMADFTLIPKII